MNSPGIEEETESNISDVNIEHLMSLLNTEKQRTKLHTKSTNSWLKKRCPSNTSIKYLYFPEELIQHENIKEIFQSFDRDNSHSLDICELVKMFKQFNINITKEDLKKLFDVMDEDKDNALNFSEFKNCTLSERGQQIFNRIMKKVRLENEKKPKKERSIYLPMSFSAMITYISYKSMRKDVLDQVNNPNLDVNLRANQFSNLITLQNLYKSDIKSDDNNKLKEKIMLKNSNWSQMKVEPLLRQLSTMRDLQISPESSFLKKPEISPFLSSRRSVLVDETEKNVGHLRKSIEKLQKSVRHNNSMASFQLNQVLMDERDEDAQKKKEDINLEVADLKKQAETKGKLQAEQLFRVQKKQKVAELEPISRNSQLDLEENKQRSAKKNILPFKTRMMQRIMDENIKILQNSEQNSRFTNLLGMNQDRGKKGEKIAKLRRGKTKNIEAKSMDYHQVAGNNILEKMKETNQKAFESILPKLNALKQVQGKSMQTPIERHQHQKLPSISVFHQGNANNNY